MYADDYEILMIWNQQGMFMKPNLNLALLPNLMQGEWYAKLYASTSVTKLIRLTLDIKFQQIIDEFH